MRHAVDGAPMIEQQLETSPRELSRTVEGALASVRAFREGLMH